MDWLLQMDVALFRYIHDGWSSPFWDRAMPFLSGNVFFIPTTIIVGLLFVWRGRLRAFLCLVVILLGIGVGDGFLYPTIKQNVGRPRPREMLASNNQSSPGGKSMPSAHAGNWMCLTVVMFVFYRRSLWVTVPLTGLVGLSRIYNSAHYPMDVVAGFVLGGGCGAAVLWTANNAWIHLGRRWFPLWWAKVPSLFYRAIPDRGKGSGGFEGGEQEGDEEPQFRPRGETGVAEPRHVSADQHWLRLGYLLLLLTLGARLLFLEKGPMELSPDEAYQWHWSKHPALSFYSKPPMIACAQWVGTGIWGDTEFGVRFLSPIIATVLGLILLRWFAREVNARAGFFVVLILATTPMMAAGAILMTVDPLSVLFWTAATFAGWRAIQEKSTARDWAWVGLWMGMGFLSKYTALFQLLSWAVLFWLWPAARKHLKRPGPWLALAILAVCSLPVLVWNHQHDWVTVSHVAEDAGAHKPWEPTLRYFLEFIGGEAGVLNPVFFVAMIWACFSFWRRMRNNPKLVVLFSMGAPLFLVYLLFTLKSRVQLNWIAPSVIPLFCLMVIYWDTRLRLGSRVVTQWLSVGLVIGLVSVFFGHNTDLIKEAFGVGLTPGMDPLRRVRAWPETARPVNYLREELRSEGKPVFVIGHNYGITAELSFYMPGSREVAARDPFVYCRRSNPPRNQFDLWPGYENRVGENAVYVRELSLKRKKTQPAPLDVQQQFESVTEVDVRPIIEKGAKEPVRYLQLFLCRGLRERPS